MAADFHTHVLPCIDDGSGSLEESLQMLRIIEEQGIRQVVATPHFYAHHDDPRRFLERRQAALQRLEAALGSDSAITLYAGAEVYYFEGISDCETLKELAISGTGYILVEMPPPPWSDRMMRELLGIYQKHQIVPIIAHIDRYITPFRTYGIPDRLREMPVLVQANASFFTRRTTRSMALRMLRNDGIHLLGSDCHNLTTRKPNLGEALDIIQRSLGDNALEELSRTENRVLSGDGARR